MIAPATYRLQFGPGFGFADAARLAPYLARLGVSHVYLAPVFAARPGSTHGYDVTDPGAFNPELGGEKGFRAMAAAFRAEGLGLLLDIVPNHMGIGGAGNRFWLDVLERGAASPHARWFDIDWRTACDGSPGKVLLPILGAPAAEALTAGALALGFDEGPPGGFAIRAHDVHRLPVRREDYAAILRAGGLEALATAAEAASADPALWGGFLRRLAHADLGPALAAFRGAAGVADSWQALAGLVERQHWRVAKFSLERDGLNYRRFFAISDLAGVRVEDPAVFEATQALPLALVGEGVADGLRIDHIDGLRDPKAYLARLRASVARPFWLVVEKILAVGEALPADWGVDGTTGYEATNLLVGLLVDPDGTETMTQAYHDFTGDRSDPADVVRVAKREVLERLLQAELQALTRRLARLATAAPRFRDIGASSIETALVETIAALDVYRTYADADGMNASDRARLGRAVAAGRKAAAWLDPDAFAVVEAALTLDPAPWPQAMAEVAEVALRAQQLTGPAMAKGLEDTALYRYARLIALNEVGSEPGRFATPPGEFHAANAARTTTPLSMLTTSTHDTKRGEDARARIAALPRHAADWAVRVADWHGLLHDPARPIDPVEEYFFYQLLLGSWPMAWRPGVPPDAAEREAFGERVRAAMLKSVREAARNTRWVFGDADYEARLAAFLDRALDPQPDNGFLASFRAFESALADDGAANALIQAALRLTVPGVPDTFQGAELWEQSMVDPDNRRPVDFAERQRLLDALPAGAAAFACWTDPVAKLALTHRLLALRRERPELFAAGDYAALALAPPLLGYTRRHAGETLVVIVALRHGAAAPEPITLPAGRWREVLRQVEVEGPFDDLATLPVAVFVDAGPR